MGDFWGNLFGSHGSQGDVNAKFGLPRDWQPTEYLGPSRGGDYKVLTPGGLRVFPHGFEREDIPLEKGGLKARVIISDIDALWLRVRAEMGAGTYPKSDLLTPKQRQRAATYGDKAKHVKPKVDIWPSILFANSRQGYVGGLWRGPTVGCAVWYKTVIEPITKSNWEGYLYHEFGHLLFSTTVVGRPDLSEALDGRA